MSYRYHFRRTIIASVFATLAPSLTHAAGFALIEANARGQGNAYAGAAAHTPDASTIFFNPAGLTSLSGNHLALAGHIIIPHSTFTNEGSSAADAFAGTPFATLQGEGDDGGSPAFIPNLYWVKSLSDDTKIGLGLNAPFGLATKYNDDWIGRYHGVVSDLKIFNANPSIGYRISDSVSIGGGVNVMVGTVELSSAIDFGAVCLAQFNADTCQGLGALPQQADGFVTFDADNFDDISVGYNLGLQFHLNENNTLGLAYRSEVDIDMEGEADFRVPAAASFVFAGNLFVDSNVSASVTLPASFSVSYAHQADKLTYLADVTWTGWSSFEELRIVYENPVQPDSVTTEEWDDTLRYSFGIDYQYNEETIYRVGVAYDETPVPSPERRTPRLPGTDRTWLSFGVTKIVDDNMTIDIGYSHLFLDEAKINNEFESSVSTLEATLSGKYDASINIFSAQVNWRY